MKRILILLLIMAGIIGVNAQQKNYSYINIQDRELYDFFQQRIQAELSHRFDKRQFVPAKSILLTNIEQFWTDGLDVFSTFYGSDGPELAMKATRYYDPKRRSNPSGVMKTKGKKITLSKDPSMTVTIEVLGGYKMLVVRNAEGAPVKAFYYMPFEDMQNGYWSLFLPTVLAGNYTTPKGDNVVFGPKMPFYSGDKYDVDPGFYRFYITPDYSSIDISYGAGRVNHGDPSSPKYGKMPGGGGAGALMGPMEWNITPTINGLTAKVTLDQKFVDHCPRIDKETELTKVQCPYEGIDGKWAFASVIPLTHSMLILFPADVLTLMRGEIYARHGDTFSNPDTQRYFDAQPWYKRSDKPVTLTDVERFNYDLIKQVENSKKSNKEYQKYIKQ